MGFVIDVGRCTECKRCMIACSLVKSGGVRMSSSRIEIRPNWPETPEIRVCRFAVSAISDSNGVVLIDVEACIGCGACEPACPYSAIKIEAGKAFKCDLCNGDPACTKECVTAAIQNRGVSK